MKPEPSKLAQLVVAYHQKFGQHAPECALRHVDPGNLAPMLEVSLSTGVPLVETGWTPPRHFEFRPSGCVVCDDDLESAIPIKKRDGEWIQLGARLTTSLTAAHNGAVLSEAMNCVRSLR